MFKKSIFLFLMAAAVSVLLLSSVSFTTQAADISVSFAVKASTDSSGGSNDVIRTAANIKVEALTGPIASYIEEGLENASKEIHQANVLARKEARNKAKAESKAASENISSGPVNLSGIEAEVLNLINQTRAQHGLSILAPSQVLTDIARARCQSMLSNNYFSHYAPDGSTFFTLLKSNGISWTNAGENLGNATPANYGSPNAFLDAWMKSPSHRDNMLRGNYRMVGIGVMDSGGRRVVTTIFLN